MNTVRVRADRVASYSLVSKFFLAGVIAFLLSSQAGAVYFSDITTSAGIPELSSFTVNINDFNNDNYPDVFAAGKLFQNVTNASGIRFQDVTSAVGLGQAVEGVVAFVDINNDGTIDLLTSRGQIWLQKNNHFNEVSASFGVKIPDNTFSLSVVDFNQDGFLDVFIGPTEIQQNNQFLFSPIRIFLNDRGQRFIDVSQNWSLDAYQAYVRGISWADYNNDFKPDGYYANYRLRPNYLINFSGAGVVDLAPQKKVEGIRDPNRYFDGYYKQNFGPQWGHTLGSAWADFNSDGYLDLWVNNLAHKFVGSGSDGAYDYRGYLCDDSKIYRNTGAPLFDFVDMRSVSGIALMPMGGPGIYKGDELWAHVAAADFDNDGLIDTYVSQVYDLAYSHSLLFKNKGNFKFEEVSSSEPIRVFDSYAAAWADFNNDGKMDLFVSGREANGVPARMRVFQNTINNQNRFLKVRVLGHGSGKTPITTQVKLFHSRGVSIRQVEGVVGSMNQQNDPILHFGLGDVANIEKMEVRWSSGKTKTYSKFSTNQTVIVEEP